MIIPCAKPPLSTLSLGTFLSVLVCVTVRVVIVQRPTVLAGKVVPPPTFSRLRLLR
jgi:hypothetical protein